MQERWRLLSPGVCRTEGSRSWLWSNCVGTLGADFRMTEVCILHVQEGNHSPPGRLQENMFLSPKLSLQVLFVPCHDSFLPNFLLCSDSTEKATLIPKWGPFEAVIGLVSKATASIFHSPTGPSDESHRLQTEDEPPAEHRHEVPDPFSGEKRSLSSVPRGASLLSEGPILDPV